MERATARFLLAHSLIFSGRVIPAQLRKSDMLVRLVTFMLSPDSSSSSSEIFSDKALLSRSLSIINCKNPSSDESFWLLLYAISRILYTAYPRAVFSPVSFTFILFSPSHLIRLSKRESIRRILLNISPSGVCMVNAVFR